MSNEEWKPKTGETVLVWNMSEQCAKERVFVISHNGNHYCEDFANEEELAPWQNIKQKPAYDVELLKTLEGLIDKTVSVGIYYDHKITGASRVNGGTLYVINLNNNERYSYEFSKQFCQLIKKGEFEIVPEVEKVPWGREDYNFDQVFARITTGERFKLLRIAKSVVAFPNQVCEIELATVGEFAKKHVLLNEDGTTTELYKVKK